MCTMYIIWSNHCAVILFTKKNYFTFIFLFIYSCVYTFQPIELLNFNLIYFILSKRNISSTITISLLLVNLIPFLITTNFQFVSIYSENGVVAQNGNDGNDGNGNGNGNRNEEGRDEVVPEGLKGGGESLVLIVMLCTILFLWDSHTHFSTSFYR